MRAHLQVVMAEALIVVHQANQVAVLQEAANAKPG